MNPGIPTRWTPDVINRSIEVLATHTSFNDALTELSAEFGFEVTKPAIYNAFVRAGYHSAMTYLKPAPVRPVYRVHDTVRDMPAVRTETTTPRPRPELHLVPPPPPADPAPPSAPVADRTYIDRGPEAGKYEGQEHAVSGETEAILAIPDCHHPYADAKSWALAVKVAHTLRARYTKLRIIVMGDFADFYSVSAHDKDPRRVSQLSEEIDLTLAALDELDAVGADVKHYIEGNHETRLARHLATQSPALAGLDALSVPALLQLEARGWIWCPYRSYVKVGSLIATHDVEHAGAYALHRTLAACGHTVIIGHTHRLGLHSDRSLYGEPRFAASFGWLGDVERVDYKHRVKAVREWQHGLGLGLMEPDGTVHLHPSPIVNGRIAVMGQIVSL